jgi:hypothetical protein
MQSPQSLVVVTPGTRVSEEYVHDGAGNLLEIRGAQATAPLTIADFTPKSGGVGRTIIVVGTGFSTVPSQNAIQLNGSPAAVLSASTSSLSFTVPGGGTTGRITVTRGVDTATSASDFTVIPGVLISDFSPKMGKAGTTVTIAGSNFDPVPAENAVAVGVDPVPRSLCGFVG